MKRMFLKILPSKVYYLLYSIYVDYRNRKFKNMSTKEMFSDVYRNNIWGVRGKVEREFYSGPGSHSKIIVDEYVSAVTEFCRENSGLVRAVDLGCGDFNVGKNIHSLFDSYIAADIVDELIAYNTTKFDYENVQFMVLNAIVDHVPIADVVFIREVFQHLKNAEIVSFLSNVKKSTSCIVVTEKLPGSYSSFAHNVDRGVGPNTRFSRGSGVVLTSPPFSINVTSTRCLNISKTDEGILRTDVYFLQH